MKGSMREREKKGQIQKGQPLKKKREKKIWFGFHPKTMKIIQIKIAQTQHMTYRTDTQTTTWTELWQVGHFCPPPKESNKEKKKIVERIMNDRMNGKKW